MKKILLQKIKNILFGNNTDKRKVFNSLSNYYPDRYINKTLGHFIILNYLKNNKINGDIVECGVGRGISLYKISKISSNLKIKKKIFGYDSFEGFPEPHISDLSYKNVKKGQWSDTSIKFVKSHFIKNNFSDFYDNYITLTKGFFNQTLENSKHKKISYLHIDCDLYQGYKDVLENLYNKVSKGGVILLDDYGHKKWPGATKAVNDFANKNNLKIQYSNTFDKYLIVDYHKELFKALQINN